MALDQERADAVAQEEKRGGEADDAAARDQDGRLLVRCCGSHDRFLSVAQFSSAKCRMVVFACQEWA